MKKTKINYDKKKGVLYIVLRDGNEERFEDISENITIEYDNRNRPIGIEVFKASEFLERMVKGNPKETLSTT